MGKRPDGKGSIYKTEDGTWRAYVRIDGGRKKKYFSGKTKRDVSQRLEAAQEAVARGLDLTKPSQTTGGYLRRWLEDDKRHSVRESTFISYVLQVERAEPHLGYIPLNQLQPAHLQKCYAELLKSGLSARSVEMVHAVLRMALRRAFRWGLIARVPTELVTPPKPARKEIQTLTPEEVRQLFDHTKGHRLHALWVLLATTGLRLGEATGLRWEDIDLETRTLQVRRSLQCLPGRPPTLNEPKTSRSRRTVYLAESTVSALRVHSTMQKTERLAAGPLWQPTGMVFCNVSGGYLDPGTIRHAFARGLKAADLSHIPIHALRHTAATYLLSLGVHAKVVQDMLGHSTIAQTMDTYSHVVEGLHRNASVQMERLFDTAGSN